ncbi:MAG TPA: transglutaminase family protein [Cytophagales bacterium]|jgi:transglutaminase-like putative cysteine protease|nr:transglutaminase family protein [Cytophagales bacterium]
MPKFKIRHVTKYVYEVPVRDSANQIMLYPLKDEFQEVVKHQIAVSGGVPVEVHLDYFGNEVGTFTHVNPHLDLVIDSKLIVVTRSKAAPVESLNTEKMWQELDSIKTQFNFYEFLKSTPFQGEQDVMEMATELKSKNSPLSLLKELCSYVYTNFKYKKGITTVETTLDEVWKIKSGVCQDFAQILISMIRLSGIPARYVSGYICPNKNGMRGEGATHAWVEAYLPFYGWLGLDPTNNCIVNDTHVRLAVGRNFSDCSPVKGTYRGTSEHTLEVSVSVSYEDGHIIEGANEIVEHEPVTSFTKNSYRRHQEIQMQQ